MSSNQPKKIDYKKLFEYLPRNEEERKMYEQFYTGYLNPNYDNEPVAAVNRMPDGLLTAYPGTEEYKQTIRDWEKEVRQELRDELAEKWFFGNSDKAKNFEPYMSHFGEMPSPVRIPSWLFAANTFQELDFRFNLIEIVAMAHVLHFTTPYCDTGYIECSGHIERWCRCTAEQAHATLMKLCQRKLITFKFLPDEAVFGLNRNLGWRANIDYIQSVLDLYGRRVDV